MEEPSAASADNIGGRARTAAGWQFLSKGINTALQMVTSIVLARLLMPEDFGIVAMAAMVTGLAGVFRDLGLGQALVQRPEISEEHTRSAYWGTLVMSLLLYGGMLLAAPYVGAYFDEPRMILVLKISALSFVLSPFSVVPGSLLRRDLDFKTPFFAGLASSLSYGAVGITAALLGYGYWALVAASLAGAFTKTLALCILTHYVPPLVPTFHGVRDLISFGAGVTGVGLFGVLADKIDYFVIGRRLDADALGLYERAFKLMTTPLALPWVVCTIIFPVFSRLQNDLERARDAFERIAALMSVLTWPVLLVLLVTAPEFVPLVFGAQWAPAVTPTQVLILAGFTKVLADVARTATKAMGARYVWGDAWRLASYVLIVFAGSWWASRWGITGVAWAVVGASLIFLALALHLLYSAIGFGISRWIRTVFAPLLLTAAAGAVSLALRSLLLSRGMSPLETLVGASIGGLLVAVAAIVFFPSAQLEVVRTEFSTALRRVRGLWPA